ncbi:MAG TPA: hypothetical protein VFK02_34365 [Kofleriaceae bacterium]|nr:hypothetical protein [Kofleriaceae bacterium]
MRTLQLIVPMVLAAACGTDAGGPGSGPPDGSGPPARGFQVVSPEVTIMPGQEITYCYYFHTPNTETMVIKKWSSDMTPGSHHMIMYTTASDEMPPGTLSTMSCGGFALGNVPSWTYSAQTPTNEVALPSDDGAGVPLGQEIAPATPAYFQMHYLNATDAPIRAHVTLNAEAYEAGASYTRTAAYVTYNGDISIPPGATDHLETMTCNVPAGAKFWVLSTHAHKQAVKTEIKDGMPASTAIPFTSTDWEHPGATMWSSAPFYTFATGKLTYECTYDNVGDNAKSTIVDGPSAAINEMCMATGYYFPATKPLICFNNLGPF